MLGVRGMCCVKIRSGNYDFFSVLLPDVNRESVRLRVNAVSLQGNLIFMALVCAILQ